MKSAAFILFTLAFAASAQRIDIATVPAYGTVGSITGRVTGIDPATVSVAVFSRVNGFTTKPSCAQTFVNPGADGAFSALITGETTTNRYAALLVPRGFVPACYINVPSIPDAVQAQVITSDFRIRPVPGQKVLNFSGLDFIVRDWPGAPGPCTYHRDNAWVDSTGRLHLTVTLRNGVYTCSEVVLTRSMGSGLGTYRVSMASRMDTLPASLVFGAFTYSDYAPLLAGREIDFVEVAKWGVPSTSTEAQFVVQPHTTAGNLLRIDLNASAYPAFETVWKASSVDFRATATSPPMDISWTWPGVVKPLDQTVHMNFWTFSAPSANAEVIVERFEFLPQR